MFDYNLIPIDGSVAMTASTDTPATSTTRSGGNAVIDLGAGGTPASGLVAVMFISNAAAADDTSSLTAYLQASDTEDMTAATDIERLGSFGVANATTGVILGSETPCVATVRFATSKRYVRVNATATIVSADMGYVKVYLTPWPFKVL